MDRDDAMPGLPALIITGYAAISQSGIADEAAAILLEPFHRRELIAALMRVMDQPDIAFATANAGG